MMSVPLAYGAELDNGTLCIHLDTTAEGVPRIAAAHWVGHGQPVIADQGSVGKRDGWLGDDPVVATGEAST